MGCVKLDEPVQLMRRIDGKLAPPNVVMYNTIMDSLCKNKLVKDAFDLYFEMVAKRISPDVVSYNTLISGLCIVGRLKDAIGLLHEMI